MKLNFTLLIIFCLLLFSIDANSQNIASTLTGGEYKFNANKTPCLTDVQREEVLLKIKSNIAVLKSQKRLAYDGAQQRAKHPLFSWPVKKKEGTPYHEVWAISNYVDQNPEFPNKVLDYNCGSKTYDNTAGYNHMGVDIYTWPFTWKMMDYDEAVIVAAAPGQIIDIGRNQFDRSCSFNNNVWNAVYIQHADGSVALYGHMKKNSPTTKSIGDMVERGEYLGIVGSSGNSTGPHLHFEVYSSINPDVLIDPFAGKCNDMNTDSWWENQKPYVNTNINALLTHSAPPILPTCPDQEITNEKNIFAPGEEVYVAVYLRDQMRGTKINLEVLRPNGSVYNNWDFDLAKDYSSSYWYWIIEVPSVQGEWTWRATYQGQVLDHKFTVKTLGIEDEDFQTASIYPNPFNDVVNIQSKSPVKKVSVVDILGKTVMAKANAAASINEINLESLSKGLYFLTLEGNDNQKKIIKMIKE